MKSIKEKANELYPELRTDSDDWDVIEEQCDRDDQRKAFVLGANYVLDVITECMPKTHSFNPNEAIDIIVNRIKELKK